MRRPGSKDPHRRERKLGLIFHRKNEWKSWRKSRVWLCSAQLVFIFPTVIFRLHIENHFSRLHGSASKVCVIESEFSD